LTEAGGHPRIAYAMERPRLRAFCLGAPDEAECVRESRPAGRSRSRMSAEGAVPIAARRGV
jgi:hypothetical protein